MTDLQSWRSSGPISLLALALALGCGSSVIGADEFAPVLPAEAFPIDAAPDNTARNAATAPVETIYESAAPPCPRPRGHFSWAKRPWAAENDVEYQVAGAETDAQLDPPFGTSYQAIMSAQIAKGEAALMVLHQYDFAPGEASLNYSGRLRLQKIAHLAAQNPFPIIVATVRYDPALDAARHASVVSELSSLPFAVPAERVVIGRSPQRAMDGLDAERVHRNLLNLTTSGDAGGPSAAPAGGAATGVPLN